MPVAEGEVIAYNSLLHPVDPLDLSSPVGGGIDTSNLFTAAVGDLFPGVLGKASGTLYNAPDVTSRRRNVFFKNTGSVVMENTTLDLYNGLKVPTGTGNITFDGASSLLTSSYQVRFTFDLAGSLTTLSGIGNGTSTVTVTAACVRIFRASIRDGSGSLTVAPCDVHIYVNGEYVGMIPEGMSWATSEFSLWVEPTLDTDTEADDVTSDPAGASYSIPLPGAGLVAASGEASPGVVPPASSFSAWVKFDLQPGIEKVSSLQFGLHPSWT